MSLCYRQHRNKSNLAILKSNLHIKSNLQLGVRRSNQVKITNK